MYDGYTRSQILENRRKWIDYLKLPTTEKAVGLLEDIGNNSARCCLGHACHLLIPETREKVFDSVYYDHNRGYAPVSIVKMLGLYDRHGIFAGGEFIKIGSYQSERSLAAYNDNTKITPQEIGAYLETVIEGGDNTPFQALTEYPE